MNVWGGNGRRSEAREEQRRCWGRGEAVWWTPGVRLGLEGWKWEGKG